MENFHEQTMERKNILLMDELTFKNFLTEYEFYFL